MSISARQLLWSAFLTLALTSQSIAGSCFTSTILKPIPFMGKDNEIFQLIDGSLWQVKYEYEYLYEYYPDVVVCPGANTLVIGDKKLNIVKISEGAASTSIGRQSSTIQKNAQGIQGVIESRIDGTYEGWKGETIYKLRNGQIWQQVGAHYHYHYAYSPRVLIYSTDSGFKIHVEDDDDDDVFVRPLK